ncbi:hypothetical protein Mal64_10570 [Pseudobythopirellula maris]|uniref:DUF362 domain-containing protein n=1 Tax=Pseudobythopirellula maris TaxID=2527991 RepID=A0A5C5ZSZ2_9BACT|nr:DUF362 domain-containing protein [Pseudobythopirellula maris]TWT90662.1 hypothetical protein Mal64_10570 [Pseudobythopirellula maris]
MSQQAKPNAPCVSRRTAMKVGGLAAAGLVAGPALRMLGVGAEPVFVASGQRYDRGLETTIRDGLMAVGVRPDSLAGKRVLLKPNLVEPSRLIPHMTTHPAMIVATAEVFRGWGAKVTVGEGPGHVRDTETALIESGVGEALADAGLVFRDLNYERVGWRRNRGRFSKLPGLYLPESVLEADLVVSMPKMKTHHWVGMTCSMKNLYGVIPGIKYGWPKNVLHHNGIPQTVADINATLPRVIGVVDGVDCMEGDGPILGSRKHMGLVAVGANPAALDATVARIMGLAPERINYLALARRRLGPLSEARIEQRGEDWRGLVDPFKVLDKPHLQKLRAEGGELVS